MVANCRFSSKESPTPRRDPMRGGLTSVESDMEIFCPEKYEEETQDEFEGRRLGAPKGPPTVLCQLTDRMTSPNDSLDVSPAVKTLKGHPWQSDPSGAAQSPAALPPPLRACIGHSLSWRVA